MVLFGGAGEHWYASHLPLYHAPHDHQVLLALRIADPRLQATLQGLRRGGHLVTIAPEPFELARLAPDSPTPLRQFRATIYDGHFERGGRRVLPAVALQVERVLVYRALAPAQPRDRHLGYFVIGGAGDCWLVHRIGGRPDFDQILRVRGNEAGCSAPTVELERPNVPGQRLRPGRASAPFVVSEERYFETGDLE